MNIPEIEKLEFISCNAFKDGIKGYYIYKSGGYGTTRKGKKFILVYAILSLDGFGKISYIPEGIDKIIKDYILNKHGLEILNWRE
jgi:hypothetical protein